MKHGGVSKNPAGENLCVSHTTLLAAEMLQMVQNAGEACTFAQSVSGCIRFRTMTAIDYQLENLRHRKIDVT